MTPPVTREEIERWLHNAVWCDPHQPIFNAWEELAIAVRRLVPIADAAAGLREAAGRLRDYKTLHFNEYVKRYQIPQLSVGTDTELHAVMGRLDAALAALDATLEP